MLRSALAMGALMMFPSATWAQVDPLPIPPSSTAVTTTTVRHYRTKEILGSTVNVEANTKVGIVDDIVLDEAGNVEYVLVMTSEKKLVTVPWTAARFDFPKRTAVIDITTERFRAIPTYSIEQYPSFSPAYRTQMDQYYGVTPERRRIIKRGNPGIVK